MILTYSTIVILILSLLFVILNKVTKKKVFKNISRILVVAVILFWTIFWIYAIEKNDQEYRRKFTKNSCKMSFITPFYNILNSNIFVEVFG